MVTVPFPQLPFIFQRASLEMHSLLGSRTHGNCVQNFVCVFLCLREAMIFIIVTKRPTTSPSNEYNEVINKFFLSCQVFYYKTCRVGLGKRSEAMMDKIFSHYPKRDLFLGLKDIVHLIVEKHVTMELAYH